MAKYKKVDNCGPVAYPDQSGRYLGDGEVAEDDADNNWAPLVALGFVVETESSVTPDVQESPVELAKAVVKPVAKPVVKESAPKPRGGSKRKSKKAEKPEVIDGGSVDDGVGAKEVDSSKAWESDS